MADFYRQFILPPMVVLVYNVLGKESFTVDYPLSFLSTYLMYSTSPMMINKITPFVNQNYWLKSLDTASLYKVSKVYKPTNDYKTLGISMF